MKNQEHFEPIAIPDHELLHLIGRGSYGEVWLARNVMGVLRAVKIIRRSTFDHGRPYDREFAGLQKFEPVSRTHASQMNILHIGREDSAGYFYYVMELGDDVNGGAAEDHKEYRSKTLKTEMNMRGQIPVGECIDLALSLCTALSHLHRHGLVHRDIKPSNIIYVNGQPKLADIGLISGIDATRSHVGTMGYAPHEGPGTVKADLYSLGKVLYEATTGRDRQEFPELPTQIAPDSEALFFELNEILLKACDADPQRRYTCASELHEDFLAIRSGQSLIRLRTTERRFVRARRWGIAALVGVGLIAIAFFYQARQTRIMRKLADANFTLLQAAEKNAAETRKRQVSDRENLYAIDIKSAHQAMDLGKIQEALNLLQKHIPASGDSDLRGFEWRYLWHQCRSEELFSVPGQKRPRTGVLAVKSGTEMFLTHKEPLGKGPPETEIHLFDTLSGKTIGTLASRQVNGSPRQLSPDGRTLATADGQNVKLWHVPSDRELMTFPLAQEFDPRGANVIFSPDGRMLTAFKSGPFGHGDDVETLLNRVCYAPPLIEIAPQKTLPNTSAPSDPYSWFVLGKSFAERGHLLDAVDAFTKVIAQSEASHLRELRSRAFLHRSYCLKGLERMPEAAADHCAAFGIPLRTSSASSRAVDLSLYYNGSLMTEPIYDVGDWRRTFLDELPHGMLTLLGIEFDCRGVIKLSTAGDYTGLPRAIESIPINQKCREIHFLHASDWRPETERTQIASYIIRYKTGKTVTIPLLYGIDIRDWVIDVDRRDVQNAKVAWLGRSAYFGSEGVRLFLKTYSNPHPEEEVESFDFISELTRSAPFLIAVSTE